MSNPDVIS